MRCCFGLSKLARLEDESEITHMLKLWTKANRKILALLLSNGLIFAGLPTAFAADGDLNFKIYAPDQSKNQANSRPVLSVDANPDNAPAAKENSADGEDNASLMLRSEMPIDDASVSDLNQPSGKGLSQTGPTDSSAAEKPGLHSNPEQIKEADVRDSIGGQPGDEATAKAETASSDGAEAKADGNKVLKGYVQVVPSGTKIPIIMDTAVDSDTSQEGDEFSARTAEDLTIDGQTAVPAGSIIRGRIATINAPKHLNRSGSVALKFDTVTTPDNRQIPLVANIVARGGVVHARRGMKDIAIETGVVGLPSLVGLGIGAVAGHSTGTSGGTGHRLGMAGGALIGVGVGVAVGAAILMAKKGKKVDVRPGDELKIELAEDLRMPTM